MSALLYPNFFNDPASVAALNVKMVHDYIMTGVCFIAGAVFCMIVLAQYKKSSFNASDEFSMLELMWTFGPIVLVLYVVIVTVPLMHFYLPEVGSEVYSVCVEARQWYWVYKGKASYISHNGMHRMLDADNVLPIPLHQYTKFSVSSGDVIHSFAVPSLALKIDALPGRISYDVCYPLLLGSFYGQCSEICGANHSFMPMNVEVIPRHILTF